MHRTDAAGYAVGNLFTDGNPSSGIPASVLDAAWLNDVQETLVSVIAAAGIALAKGDYTQLLTALRSAGVFQTQSQGDSTTKAATTAFVAAAAIGLGQSWTDVTSSRALNTSYTNTTGKPIMISVCATNSVSNSTVALALTIGGVSSIANNSRVAGGIGNDALAVVAIVPPGATYQASATQANLLAWREMR
ncbi:hypothetical protein SAMN06265795_12252 [Noviherbaspirillum humi]|uniref:Uncharacterized protein n=1 Tax=Noviherbaspirillum humi TaxID=1688639 RepID=A0A239LGW8_9BURK|nr:hypothetical protein [Noviherbaspirillum humi]SNT29118.1 hypothetical protein SAMN06265795_12252 [Noviherbaspirillum humi]